MPSAGRTGEVRWKQAMHMLRLLLAGRTRLRTGEVLVDVSARRDELLAVRRGERAWAEVTARAADLTRRWPGRWPKPRCRPSPTGTRSTSWSTVRRADAMTVPAWAADVAAQLPPAVFATVSGAHLYGFASVDSDLDLRGVHLLPLTEVVGLRTGPETLQSGGVRDGVELDVVTHELASSAGCCSAATATCWSSCCPRWWS